MAFHKFIYSILKGRPIEVYGDGRQLRDFTYVEDVAEATLLAALMDDDAVVGETINIGSGKPVYLIDAIRIISDILEVEPEIIFKEKQKGDVDATYAATSKAQKLLGWRPVTTIREGLEIEAKWLKNIIQKGII